MRKTALHKAHTELGAKMVEFAGWHMPVRYSSISVEHLAVRNNAGLFDISHMGEIEVAGIDSTQFCEYITTNDVRGMKVNQARYTFFCNYEGGVIDDVIIYKLDEERYLFCVNSSNTEKAFNWALNESRKFEADVHNKSLEYSQLALQGPSASEILAEVLGRDAVEIKRFYFETTSWNNVDVMIARTGYTGENGFEIFLPWNDAQSLWKEIMDAGVKRGLLACGLGARDTLRLEMGYPLYGQELDDATTPYEAGLGSFVKPDKGDFIGRSAIRELMAKGFAKTLIGFVMLERGIPRTGYEIFKNLERIGHVTSGTMSPCLENGIGMGYVKTGVDIRDNEIEILIHGKKRKAQTIKTPFYTQKPN